MPIFGIVVSPAGFKGTLLFETEARNKEEAYTFFAETIAQLTENDCEIEAIFEETS